MSGTVNKVSLHDLYISQVKSIPQIAEILGLSRSTARKLILEAGIELRTRADGVRAARDRLGVHMKGVARTFSPSHVEAIRASAILRGARTAKGVSEKPNGYLEYTRGPHKGRTIHVVEMEMRLGRSLLPDEVVHHIDGNKQNNEMNNLALVTRSGHMRLHRREEALKASKI